MITAVRSTAIVARELLAWSIGRRSWVRVDGESMQPALEAGDVVLVGALRPSPGHIVVFEDPEQPARRLIKRYASRGDRGFAVMSDNPAVARDSRHLGSISFDRLIGRATLVFDRKGRIRRLRDPRPPEQET